LWGEGAGGTRVLFSPFSGRGSFPPREYLFFPFPFFSSAVNEEKMFSPLFFFFSTRQFGSFPRRRIASPPLGLGHFFFLSGASSGQSPIPCCSMAPLFFPPVEDHRHPPLPFSFFSWFCLKDRVFPFSFIDFPSFPVFVVLLSPPFETGS